MGCVRFDWPSRFLVLFAPPPSLALFLLPLPYLVTQWTGKRSSIAIPSKVSMHQGGFRPVEMELSEPRLEKCCVVLTGCAASIAVSLVSVVRVASQGSMGCTALLKRLE